MNELPIGAEEDRRIFLRLGSQTIREMLKEIHQFESVCGNKPDLLKVSNEQMISIEYQLRDQLIEQLPEMPAHGKTVTFFGIPLLIDETYTGE